MSECKRIETTYWGYTYPHIDGTTYLFYSYDEAFRHADKAGCFDELSKAQFEDLASEFFCEYDDEDVEEMKDFNFPVMESAS